MSYFLKYNKMKLLIYTTLAILLTLVACQPAEFTANDIQNGVHLSSENGMNLKVQFYADNIVRVTKWDANGKADKNSLVVIQKSIPVLQVERNETEREISLSANGLTVHIDKRNGNIEYRDENGILLKETGKPTFEPVTYDGDKGVSVQQHFQLSPDEGIYGLGQHQYGYFNYRGKEVKLVQSNTDAVNPFLISTNNYGILWDNYSMTIFNDEGKTTSLWSDMGDNIDYYFVAGDNMDKVISGYRYLSGRAPMYGKYAFGYWQSKEHYDTQEELLEVARRYRELEIPIDNMIQDWDYWNGPENWSGMFFDKTLFPDPEGMMSELRDMNYHAIISIWPALGSATEIHKDMDSKGFLYDPIGWAGFKYYDPYKPGANELYWQYLKNGIFTKGLDGWWIDSTEPDVINALSKEATEYELKKMGSNHMGSFARYLNTFSLVMLDDIHRFWRDETDERRAYILTRSCFAGQQRNAATTWSGDIGASWEIYRDQISAGLNHCMAGIPYWTFDIGAFVLGSYGGVFNKGGSDPAYHELYTRMFQFGAFCPIFRSHGSDTPREMWEMGEYMPALVKFDKLRYRLLPYIYSLSWQVTSNDYTMMRGLPMDFLGDKNTYNIDNQFMFGPSMMVCPVTEFMYHRPPTGSVVVAPEYFTTAEGKQGLHARYYSDNKFENLTLDTLDTNVDINWYGGRPAYVTDSMYSIRWEGLLTPSESGGHQFHIKSYDTRRLFIDGKEIGILQEGNEAYTDFVELEAGKSYNFVAEVENKQTGAARMNIFWKTPSMFAEEKQPVNVAKEREVYLPDGTVWYDFWTGKKYEGGSTETFDAPIDHIPLLVKAGSIIPMGPLVQYSTEKPADPLEIRIYPGADGHFTLYEDENDNYNYEKGIYSTIEFTWDDEVGKLAIGKRNGEFPGMLQNRTMHIILVNENTGIGIDPYSSPQKTVAYNGDKLLIQF
jgi:alpha-D-xyloside xylohydrolase